MMIAQVMLIGERPRKEDEEEKKKGKNVRGNKVPNNKRKE
jgi:hypothetical protein